MKLMYDRLNRICKKKNWAAEGPCLYGNSSLCLVWYRTSWSQNPKEWDSFITVIRISTAAESQQMHTPLHWSSSFKRFLFFFSLPACKQSWNNMEMTLINCHATTLMLVQNCFNLSVQARMSFSGSNICFPNSQNVSSVIP